MHMGGRAVYAQFGASINIVETARKFEIVRKTTVVPYYVDVFDDGGYDVFTGAVVSAHKGAGSPNGPQILLKLGKLSGDNSREGVDLHIEI
jgi:hypothetical protein